MRERMTKFMNGGKRIKYGYTTWDDQEVTTQKW